MLYFFSNTNSNKALKFIVIFVFILASHTTVSAQNDTNLATENEINSENKVGNGSEVSSSNTSNFILWFMGTKQDPIIKMPAEHSNLKKQMIILGTAPNRLLMKAFLKKATNLDSMIS
jgi:hypothetical protein